MERLQIDNSITLKSETEGNTVYDLSFNSSSPNIPCVICGIVNQFTSNYFAILWLRIIFHHFFYTVQRSNSLFTQRYLKRTMLYAASFSTIMTFLPIAVKKNVYDVYGFNGTICLLYEPSLRLWFVLPSLLSVLLTGFILLPVTASKVLKSMFSIFYHFGPYVLIPHDFLRLSHPSSPQKIPW